MGAQTNFKLAASWLCNQPAAIISEPCSPTNEPPCKPHHPAHHATFFTPWTKLNWTSRKPPSSIHRLTYLGYYPLQFPLVSCSQTPHLSFPLAVQSTPPVSVSYYSYYKNQPITQYLPVLPSSVQLIYQSWFSRHYSFL
ncbi:hypothetical protein ATANTOWER_018561 [Ataeniobius toweri]|uniref:Uncharacterized protein n=1 Tax=Ataeniobius toweri TaxID=208326 RepID=A0ABU7CHG3_9TELE|nr:hypothetical protein [Ataeniobius toweri]